MWLRAPLEEMKYLFKLLFHFFALVSRQKATLNSTTRNTQQAIHPEFSGKWETECLDTRFLLSILPCAGYSVKLIVTYVLLCCRTYITIKSHPNPFSSFTVKVEQRSIRTNFHTYNTNNIRLFLFPCSGEIKRGVEFRQSTNKVRRGERNVIRYTLDVIPMRHDDHDVLIA